MKGIYKATAKIPKYGALGCGVSHAALVKYANLLNLDFIAIFEDDAYPCDEILEKLTEYLTGIPDDCDILKIGWSGVYKNENSFQQKFNRQPKSWGTFAYVIFKRYYKRYFENFKKSYISDHDVMSSDSVNTYHTRQRLFYYYNQESDVLIHNNSNKLSKQPGFSMQYAKEFLPIMNSIEPRPSMLNALTGLPPFLYRPNGGNAGDIVIAFAELQLFDKLGLKYTQINGDNKQ
jgi:GR25 family glycosyltransferase involved in LPS biosynthesis